MNTKAKGLLSEFVAGGGEGSLGGVWEWSGVSEWSGMGGWMFQRCFHFSGRGSVAQKSEVGSQQSEATEQPFAFFPLGLLPP